MNIGYAISTTTDKFIGAENTIIKNMTLGKLAVDRKKWLTTFGAQNHNRHIFVHGLKFRN